METAPSAPRQRSPWFYVLLGCGGVLALMCLGTGLTCGGCLYAGKQLSSGVTDPAVREANAREQLGGLPSGYAAAMSVSVFGIKDVTVLTDATPLPDGGFAAGAGRLFIYTKQSSPQRQEALLTFVKGPGGDAAALDAAGVELEVDAVLKRGVLSWDGKKASYVAVRGAMRGMAGSRVDVRWQGGSEPQVDRPAPTPSGPGADLAPPRQGLHTVLVFECADAPLRTGVFSQSDLHPEQPAPALELAGTVADEAELAKLLKPMSPCGR